MKKCIIIFVFLQLGVTQQLSALGSLETYNDTLRFGLSLENFAKCKKRWQRNWPNIEIRIDERIVEANSEIPGLKAEYVINSLPSIVTLTANQVNRDSTVVSLKYESTPKKHIANLWTKNIRATLIQSCGSKQTSLKPIHKKSHITHFGLTMINSGLGYFYSSHNSPTITSPEWVDWGNALFDLAFTVLLFTDDSGMKTVSYIALPIYKGLGLLRHINISKHNSLVETEWNFWF